MRSSPARLHVAVVCQNMAAAAPDQHATVVPDSIYRFFTVSQTLGRQLFFQHKSQSMFSSNSSESKLLFAAFFFAHFIYNNTTLDVVDFMRRPF